MSWGAGIKPRASGVAAAVAIAAALGGCSGSAVSNTKGPRWLVRVKDGYANVYAYPSGNRPGTKAAIELGTKFTTKQLDAAAAKLGVPLGNVTRDLGA